MQESNGVNLERNHTLPLTLNLKPDFAAGTTPRPVTNDKSAGKR